MPRKYILVSGRVQGVGLRYHAHMLAEACGLTGWVRNLDTGEVKMEIQGFQKDINKFLEQIDKRSIFIRIDHMEIEDRNEIQESGFDIRY